MSIELSNLPSIVRRRQRLGRGEGGGRGKTSGRGNKGQKARSKVRRGFEGGQMPIFRRLPKSGFKRPWREVYGIVSTESLNCFSDNEDVTPEKLKNLKIVKKSAVRIKVLAGSPVTKRLKVTAHAFSAKAKEAIEAAGGTTQVVD